MLSEDSILDIIHRYFPNKDTSLLLGRGDDCAVLDVDTSSSHLVVTTDIFLEDSHFRTSYFSPESIGYKALAVNISDIYAMGAMSLTAQLALSFPKGIDSKYLEKILSSMADIAKEHNFTLSGGDLSKGDKLNLTVTLIGTKEKSINLYRNQAKVDDIVYIIGDVGLSRLALKVLEEESEEKENYPYALQAHFFPQLYRESTLQLVEFVKQYPNENFSLMDVSDGLAQDLPRLTKCGVDLSINVEFIHHEVKSYCFKKGTNPLEFAICGGEDYALLGTCPPHIWNEFIKVCPKAKKIGLVVEDRALFLNGTLLKLSGYDHFT